MMTIDQYDHDNLIVLLNNAEPHVQHQHNALCRVLNIRNRITHEFQALTKTPKHITGQAVGTTLAITLPICFCALPAIIIFFTSIFSQDLFSSFIFIPIVVIVIGGILGLEELIFRLIYKDTLSTYNKKLIAANEEVIDLTRYIYANTMQHEELQIIPVTYQNPYVLQKAKEYLYNYRATNWREAINLYEQERQLQQINNTIKQNMLQNQQLIHQELSLLRSIQADINFNALATAGLIFFK